MKRLQTKFNYLLERQIELHKNWNTSIIPEANRIKLAVEKLRNA